MRMFFSMCFCLAAVSLDLKRVLYGTHFILIFPPLSHKQQRTKPQTFSVSKLGSGYLRFMLLITYSDGKSLRK